MMVGELIHSVVESVVPSWTVLTPNGLQITAEFFLHLAQKVCHD